MNSRETHYDSIASYGVSIFRFGGIATVLQWAYTVISIEYFIVTYNLYSISVIKNFNWILYNRISEDHSFHRRRKVM